MKHFGQNCRSNCPGPFRGASGCPGGAIGFRADGLTSNERVCIVLAAAPLAPQQLESHASLPSHTSLPSHLPPQWAPLPPSHASPWPPLHAPSHASPLPPPQGLPLGLPQQSPLPPTHAILLPLPAPPPQKAPEPVPSVHMQCACQGGAPHWLCQPSSVTGAVVVFPVQGQKGAVHAPPLPLP